MELEKRVERLEKLHYYGGILFIGIVVIYLIKKNR